MTAKSDIKRKVPCTWLTIHWVLTAKQRVSRCPCTYLVLGGSVFGSLNSDILRPSPASIHWAGVGNHTVPEAPGLRGCICPYLTIESGQPVVIRSHTWVVSLKIHACCRCKEAVGRRARKRATGWHDCHEYWARPQAPGPSSTEYPPPPILRARLHQGGHWRG